MVLPGPGLTTAMGIMPHKDMNRALQLALSLDIPFWPQLPLADAGEDMYVQAGQGFPGLTEQMVFDRKRFYSELDDYFSRGLPALRGSSLTYGAFFEFDLAAYLMVRGQIVGPLSMALKILDEQKKPIIYYDDVRAMLYDFLQRKANEQYDELYQRNARCFVWFDEPGIELLSSGFTGFTLEKAKEEYTMFLDGVKGPRGVHLCGNPDWDFLLGFDLDILSFDAFRLGHLVVNYRERLCRFLDRGGVIAWGLVPTHPDVLEHCNPRGLAEMFGKLADALGRLGYTREQILAQSMFAPATCNILGAGCEAAVETAFSYLAKTVRIIRDG
ncbi:MAG: hypothetical protein AB1497_10910 [Bacillota bacterium]